MGVYQYTDPQTGRSYKFNHAGEAPSNEDFAEIQNILAQERVGYAEKYENVFGQEFEAPDDGTAIGRGYERGKKQIKQAFGETLGTIGEESGLGFLANYGQGVEERARQELGELLLEQPERMQSTDVGGFGSALTYAGEVVGEQIPQLGLGLGAAVAAPIVAGATGVAAPFVIGAGGAAAVTAPILFGNNIQRQEDEVAAGKKASVDVGDALTATFGQATLEGVSDKLLLGVGKPLIGLGKAGWKGLFLRTTGRATGGATTEGLTEVGQQMMERAQAGLPIDSEDAIAEYREAAIAGGLIGGGTRATIGSFGERGDTVPVETGTTETTPPAPVEPEAGPILPQLEEGQMQGELFAPEAELTPAQQTEARNAADPAPLEGAAEQTEEQRAVDAAVVATDAATPSAALVKEEANLEDEVARMKAKATKAAQAKTQEYLPGLEPVAQEDRTAALESEQTGKKIEVGATETVDTAQGTEVTKEMLDGIGVFGRAPLRKRVIGKNLTDPEVQQQLRSYAKNSNVRKKIPELEARVEGLLGGVSDTGTRPTGTGDGAEGSGQGVVGSGRAVPERRDTPELATPDQGSVGTSVPVSGPPAVDAGSQSDTLEAEPEVTPDERGVAAVQQLAEQATATPVQQPVQQAPATPTMQQAAIPGQVTSVAQQNIPAPVPPAPRVAPAQGSPVPQAQLQEVEAQRDAAAQAQIEAVFENNRGKQPEVREYHDTQLDPRDVAEVTTAVDKEGVVELLNTKDGDLDAQGKAAKLYFKRFRRPVDALAEIGATAVVGPTQTIEKDYTPKTFAFYKGMTQKSAMNARRWVHANMSDSAIQEMGRARRVANRNTAKYNPSDAYIGVVKAAKSIQQKEDNALKNQLNRYLASPEVNYQAPADLDQSLRAEATGQLAGERTSGPITGSFKPVKGQTAFDSYMTGMGFKKRKVPNKDEYNYFDPENDNKVLTPEEVQEFYDGLAYTQSELGFLLIDPVHGLDQALLPSIRNAVQRGDLQFALNAIASTSQVDRIRQIAGKLAEAAGTTQVQVVDDLQQMLARNFSISVGRKAAGMFEPETNTIYIDASNGMNVHTILHEMTHAATWASLANPSLPEVKQLQTIFNAVREQFGEVYGTANLDEFVAEAFSNPEFQSALALTKVDGGKMSGWEKFTGAIKRIVRKLLGLSPSASALTEVDRIVDGMLAPSPATRAAPNMLLLGRTKQGATDLYRRHVTAVPLENKNRYEQARDIINANTPSKLKNMVLSVQPVNNLARIASDKIPFANELNVLIDQASGALRKAFEPVDVIHNDYRAYKKANPKGYAKMQALMNRATQDEVDPARPRDTYAQYWLSYYDMKTEKTVMKSFKTAQERDGQIAVLNTDLAQKYAGQDSPRSKAKKAGEPSSEKAAIWDALNKEYQSLGKQGQDLYKITRDMGEAAQDRIMPAVKARISAMGLDATAQKTAFEKLSDLLHAQGGVIRPYFRLGRHGDFRLSYHAPDPLRNGGIELFTEYYDTEKDLMQAQENVVKYLQDIGRGDDVSKIETGKRDSKRDYGKAPSSSFVFDVLSTLQAAGVDQASIDRIIDLSLDAIPERSFMQSFRSRKERSDGKRGILGALGDRTPSGMPGMEADPATMFRDNFRGIEKQLVQLEYGARIQGFRNKLKDGGYFQRLDTTDIAKKLDKIAEFAQAPSMARWSQVATSMGFAWTMGANISSALNVMFDIPMAVQPQLAGEYGFRKATSALADATKLFMGSPDTKMVTVMGADGQPVTREVKLGKHNKGFDNYNFDDPNLDPNIRKYKTLVEKAGARGMFNQSIDQEHVDLSDRRDVMAKINQVSGFLVHHGERFGRQITLMATYDLELQKRSNGGRNELTQADYDAAAEKAMNTAELTLGSTASAGRPVWAQNPVGNVVFLFKRFAVSRYYYMAHLLDQSLAGADPETRKIARQQLAYFMMNTAAIAGASGMPLMGAVGAIYDAFADDDEDDFDAMMRKMMGGTMYDGLANELLGIDIASRVSMNSLLYRQPFIDKDQSAFFTLVEQLGGPVIGVGLSVERGLGQISEGNIQRGFEAMAPAVMRNVSKAQRFTTEGANTMRGNPIVDDINPYNSFMQLLGFAPADYVENLKINSNERRKQNAVNEKRRKLMRLHNMAKTEGDTAAVRKVLDKIREYNNSLPANFQKDGRIDSEDLRKSLTGFITTTGKMVNGIVYTDAMRKSAEDYK
jgi:hypothetical protein